MVDLSIIIVSWNCKAYLEGCLKSIEYSAIRHSYEVYVVDNGSSDGTVQLLERNYPAVKVIANAENLGYAAANNQVLRVAHTRWAVLLNPDTVVHPGAFDVMIRFFDRHNDAWVVGPSMLNGDGSLQRSGVRFPSNWNIFVEALFLDRVFPRSRLFGKHRELYEDPVKPRIVDYVQGACFMVSSEAIERVGVLDERFFMYFEETDWCYRMKKAGGRVYFCPDAVVTHFGAGELGHFDEQRLMHYHRSLLLFYRAYYPEARLFIVRLILFFRSLIRLLLWFVLGVVKPSLRAAAKSSLKGYGKTLVLLLRAA